MRHRTKKSGNVMAPI